MRHQRKYCRCGRFVDIKCSGTYDNPNRLFHTSNMCSCYFFDWIERDVELEYQKMRMEVDEMKQEINKWMTNVKVVQVNSDWLKQSCLTYFSVVILMVGIITMATLIK